MKNKNYFSTEEDDPMVDKMSLLDAIFYLYSVCECGELKKDLAKHMKKLCEELAGMFTSA